MSAIKVLCYLNGSLCKAVFMKIEMITNFLILSASRGRTSRGRAVGVRQQTGLAERDDGQRAHTETRTSSSQKQKGNFWNKL